MASPTLRRVFLVLATCVLCVAAGGQEPLPRQVRFDSISVDEGLSNTSVSAIVQDREGYVWFATQGGLNRYNGYSIDVFEHDPFDENSLLHNQLQTMILDDDGTLWIGTYGGLNHLDPHTKVFSGYSHDPDDASSLSNNVVVAIERDASGSLWVGTLDGLNRLDDETGSFVRYGVDPNAPGSLPNKVVRALYCDQSGTLWVGTYGGLSRYDAAEDRFETFAPIEGDPSSLPTRYVMAIAGDEDASHTLWLGCWEGGVARFDTRTGRARTYPLAADNVYTILRDSKCRVWAGTWGGGLFILDPERGETVRYRRHDSAFGTTLSHDVVYSLLEDEAGIVWIGTNGGGINTYVDWENRARFLVHHADDETSLAAGKVNTLLPEGNDAVWIGIYNGGLNRYDRRSGQVSHYRHDPDDPTSLSNDIVNSIFRDATGALWVGTNDGLNVFVPADGTFQRIYNDGTNATPPEDIINEIFEDSRGNFWIGTFTAGVAVRFNGDDEFTFFPPKPDDSEALSDGLVRDIFESVDGTVWIGTNDGLNRFLPGTQTFRRYKHNRGDATTIASDDIRDIFESSDGSLWIATGGGGVNRYDPERDAFSVLTRRDGLASNQVLATVEAPDGTLWFSTNAGISIYDRGSESLVTLDRSNGLLSNEMTDPSIVTDDGSLFFGTVSGVAIFDPEEELVSDYMPPVVLTRIQVLGQDVSVGDELVLQPGESYFSFEYAALDYASPEHNQYAYMLEGFDADWNVAETRTFGSYTNLDPGSYTLRVIGSGSRGNWNRNGVSLAVEVRRPWWQSRVATVAYVVALLGVIGVALDFTRTRQQKMVAQVAELNRMVNDRTAEIDHARRIAERATHAKSLFLANMSHEIRTPLNAILGMLSLLADEGLTERQMEYVKASIASADALKTLVGDLLDFESIESGRIRLAPREFRISDLVSSVVRTFEPQIRPNNLAFHADTQVDPCPDVVIGDPNRLEQILSNLVANAIKYTEKGSIHLTARASESATPGRCVYSFSVRDTGIGIPEEMIDSIFDSFTQLDMGYTKTRKGVGLGLAIVKQLTSVMGGTVSVTSEVGSGSTFTVEIDLERGQSTPRARTGTPARIQIGAYREAPPGTTVLVCEDEAINRMYLQQILKRRGFIVQLAVDGVEAVKCVREGSFDAILMDLRMPNMNGLEATREIRRMTDAGRAGTDRLPILALTAHTQKEDIQQCMDAGMDGYLSKPVNEAELVEKLLGILGDS